jgi:hypothetical protein
VKSTSTLTINKVSKSIHKNEKRDSRKEKCVHSHEAERSESEEETSQDCKVTKAGVVF